MVDIYVYPVGLLAALLFDYRMVVVGEAKRGRFRTPRQLRILADNLFHGRWRTARMCFNGYLAEPRGWPEGLERCGSGWTRGRALDSLGREMAKAGHIMVRGNYS